MDHRFKQLPAACVNYLDLGGGEIDTLAVHGLGGSATNWLELARLGDGGIRAIDLPGFGLSPPARRHRLSLFRDVTIQALEDLGGRPVLLGNSMGGLVAMMAASARPDLVRGLVLIAPAVRPAGRFVPHDPNVLLRLLAPATPVLGPWLTRTLQSRITPAEQARMTFRLITPNPSSISPQVMAVAEEMGAIRRNLPWIARAFHESVASTGGLLSRRHRFDRMTAAIVSPTLLIYGDQDPVVDPQWMAALGRRHPGWSTVVMPGVGHVPMLEAPVWTAEIIADWRRTIT